MKSNVKNKRRNLLKPSTKSALYSILGAVFSILAVIAFRRQRYYLFVVFTILSGVSFLNSGWLTELGALLNLSFALIHIAYSVVGAFVGYKPDYGIFKKIID